MSNVCLNELTVTGNKEELDRFLDAAQGRAEEAMPFSLQSLFPLPASLDTEELVSPAAGKETWYSWCLHNWGTKGDVIEFCECVRGAHQS